MVLEKQVLVLNKSWIPVNVTTVKRAVTLLYQELARAVCHRTYQTYDFNLWVTEAKSDAVVKTVSLEIPVPEVIVLTQYNGLRTEAKMPFSRSGLLRRDKYVCQYCRKQFQGAKLTIDHVLPKSRGGITEWTNCVIACHACNAKKDNKTPKEAGMKLKVEPVVPNWSFKMFDTEETPIHDSWRAFVRGKK